MPEGKTLDVIGRFIIDLYETFKSVPSEVRRWWRDGHTRTEWLYVWVDGNVSDPGKAPRFYTHDERSISSHNDYRLWRTLGRMTDILLLVIVLTVVVLILVSV